MKSGLVLFMMLLALNAHGHETAGTGEEITVDEQLGSRIPEDVMFRDEKGNLVSMDQLVDRPTVVAPVYLSCNNTCPLLLLGLADVISRSKLRPGNDYRVLAVSFDSRDTPELAAEKKPGYIKAVDTYFPEDDWKFLTGSEENIQRFAKAAGFGFKREQTGFSHPVTLIFLAPDRKIVRYLYGVTFLPFEFEMAVTEASRGTPVSIARKALMYCMSYDSQQKRYVLNTLRVAGSLMILALASFSIYLAVSGRKKRRDIA